MAFSLGGFTQGLTEGAKAGVSMYDQYQTAQQRKAATEAERQNTDIQKQAFDAGKKAIPTTPSSTDGAGAGAGAAAGTVTSTPLPDLTPSSSGAPVAPIDLSRVPLPNHLQGVTTTPQSAAPDAGAAPEAPATPPPATPPPTPAPASPVPGNMPTPNMAPSLASTSSRTTSGLGGAAAPSPYQQSFSQPAPPGAVARPMTWTDTSQPTPTSAAPTAVPGVTAASTSAAPDRSTSPAAMPTYDDTPQNLQPRPPSVGLDLSHPRNRPVGQAVKDWWSNTKTPDLPLKHPTKDPTNPQHTSLNNVGRKLAGALGIG